MSANAVKYLVLGDTANPYLLARVRWPDVFQAMSPARPYWQDDPGLFDLPYDPGSTTVTFDLAAAIAAEWGVRLPADDAAGTSGPPVIRRMPADWSNLSPAEKRTWSIDFESARGRSVASSGSRLTNRRLRRRKVTPPVVRAEPPQDELVAAQEPADVIDLTETPEDALATVEDA